MADAEEVRRKRMQYFERYFIFLFGASPQKCLLFMVQLTVIVCT